MTPGLPGRRVVHDPRFDVPAPSPRYDRTLAVLGLVAMLVAAMALAGRESASGDEAEAGLEPIGELVPDETLDPRVLEVELDGGAYRRAIDRLETALFAREQTRRDHRVAIDRLGDLTARLTGLDRDLVEITDHLEGTSAELAALETELMVRAVERYVHHGADIDSHLDPVASIEAGREAMLSAEADEAQLARRSELTELMSELESSHESTVADQVITDLELSLTRGRVEELGLALAMLEDDIEAAEDDLIRARRSAYVRGLHIPVIALDAYLTAESTVFDFDPGCGLRWWMLAGVARVESRHGELGGRRLRADGRVGEPIIGVALDGGPRVQLVVDTDSGRLDGDAEFDRAVGPLQFIPETWARLARDGNHDGTEDPQNIYDAALAAGVYLCRLGSDLGRTEDLRSALHGYNSSWEYVDAVHGHATRYSELDIPLPEPAEDADAAAP